MLLIGRDVISFFGQVSPSLIREMLLVSKTTFSPLPSAQINPKDGWKELARASWGVAKVCNFQVLRLPLGGAKGLCALHRCVRRMQCVDYAYLIHAGFCFLFLLLWLNLNFLRIKHHPLSGGPRREAFLQSIPFSSQILSVCVCRSLSFSCLCLLELASFSHGNLSSVIFP